MSAIDARLAELGITLPTPAAPVANYVGTVRTGNTLVISGQLCFNNEGKLAATGKLGTGTVTVEDARVAARYCAINILAQIKAAVGSLDNLRSLGRRIPIGRKRNLGNFMPLPRQAVEHGVVA